MLQASANQPLFWRKAIKRVWHDDHPQSFTALRFMPSDLMGWHGRAVATDPDGTGVRVT